MDEIHEVLCTSKDEMKDAKEQSKKENKDSGFFQEKNRRAGREVRVLSLTYDSSV